ncbi:MAG: hypothetical protein OIF48_14615, partial [Silicimonas sp.]|nr:hypothetical protein [Silicimonas sp.]
KRLPVVFGAPEGFSQAGFLARVAASGQDGDLHRWFEAAHMTAEAGDLLRAAVAPGSLVIGYELSQGTRDVLDLCGVPWIDIWLHPVRFYEDLLFAVQASDPGIRRRLSAHQFDEQPVFDKARGLKTALRQGRWGHQMALVEGAILFAGQLPQDKTVLSNGRFQRLQDHSDTFRALSLSVPHVYYLDHPKLGRRDADVSDFLAGFPNVSRLEAPTYALLADPRIVGVAALSSSLCVEAGFFGKTGRRFLPPAFPLEGEAGYVGTFRKIADPEFWRDILSPLVAMSETPCAVTRGDEAPLRDRIGFHWSEVDLPGRQATDQLVSFDVFDTLLTRIHARPDHVFEAMAVRAADLAGCAPEQFRAARQTAERRARKAALAEGREEPRLRDIYRAMVGTEETARVDALMALEIAEEIRSIRALPEGRRHFDAALARGQAPVILSDSCHDAETIAVLLEHAGFAGWLAIFTSADQGRTKASGGLYEVVRDTIGVGRAGWHHYGNSSKSDVEAARASGLKATHLPCPMERLRADFPTLRPAVNRLESEDVESGLLIKSAALACADHGASASPAWRFGAVCLGPLLAGFAIWLHRTIRADGVTRLGFLTREGEVMRRCFTLLFPEIETFDVIASRHIAGRTGAVEAADILAAAERVSQGETVAAWCQRIAGIPPDPQALAQSGISDPQALIGNDCPRERLRSFATLIAEDAVRANRALAGRYQAYLGACAMEVPGTAIVDIGYRGTMQSAIEGFIGRELRGYYLAAAPTGKAVRGYLTETFRPGGTRQIERNRAVYETVLCAAGATYTDLQPAGGSWTGLRHGAGDDAARAQFVDLAHAGALAMVQAFRQAAPDPAALTITPESANLALATLLSSPDEASARLIGGLTFDDARASVRPVALADPAQDTVPLWSEAAVLLRRRGGLRRHRKGPSFSLQGPYGLAGWRHLMTPFVALAIGRIGQAHDVDHFRDDPIGFFRRLSDPRYRRIGRWLYPKD